MTMDDKLEQISKTVGLTPEQIERVLHELISAGVVQYTPAGEKLSEATLDDAFTTAKQSILTKDIYAAARQAREKSHKLLEDQGLASMAILFSDVFAGLLEDPDRLLELA